ncbi:hypothetical protein A3A71_02140 [Candidatus Berkelbacteria bacterium RIFCSPLOWO2_01_FULL_50_28]|uniref:Pseudouridine synthase RsuA/RluA-like domain-containing protein n=1 Tax=Candidatus Berkelbacteria bacterium RIFCSPLOWO2_01_FULL_50_28 TaxID=1797471 RepID=A0A1F5EC81_9BACT|nr:MAG: hypothetical protein A2807_00535 [Candidatus Berkelbacteria bacterium RIFCSPHIGHO2_01_FULL_50_36]OGD63238.1 MAG: hypothetical protein A3F39_02405 [Candidatus Berkelbacteria bacterium RIFCSPHIGHO2_12_FULL_50_11]OGD64824.1 MAG: hypothetical protein A3A71_02140 [Candidatus Berkelbacteria bacterium RIFCSPLOWO2_01_FULL_50_28]
MKKFEIIHETDRYIAINKPALYSVEISDRYPSVVEAFKPTTVFVVHRLDVETTGALIVAKTEQAQSELRDLWQGRAVKKTYLALVLGETPPTGEIELSIERDNKNDRQKVVLLPSDRSRAAITMYTRLAVGEWQGEKVSLVECHPVTGRTHQIRVHLQSANHPILGDKIYGNKRSDNLSKELGINRQMLHAFSLVLPHEPPLVAKVPLDFNSTLTKLGIDLDKTNKTG